MDEKNNSSTTSTKKNHNKYRRDKPWDNETVDHWKIDPWKTDEDQLPGGRLLEESSFATLFPKGLIIRTTQIVGSFVILNGTINYLQLREHHKIQRAIAG